MNRQSSEPRSAPLFVIFFFSGASALIYEVIWTRLMTLAFGVTSFAVATVVAAFMGGLAVGSFLFGRLADRWRRHLLVYGFLELGIGLFGLLMPEVMARITRFSPSTVGAGESPAGFAATTFVLSFTVLLIPTSLMGATLPVLSKHLARRPETLGRRIGLLYAINTFGGMAGAFASAFLLIVSWGVHRTNLFAVGLNLTLAVVSILLTRGGTSAVRTAEPSVSGRAAPVSRTVPPTPPSPAYPRALVLTAYGFAGATALCYQVLLTRLVIFLLWDTTIYSFATILTAYLGGIALGGAIFARVVDRWRPLLGVFGLLQIGVGTVCVLLVPTVGALTGLRLWLWESLYSTGELAVWRYLGIKFIMAFSVVLLPTVLMGATFPVVNRIVSREVGKLGRSVGAMYSANTVGAIAGSLLGGFWIITRFGVSRGILIVSVVNFLLGIVLLGRERAWPARRRAAFVAVGVLLGTAAAFAGPERPVIRFADLLTNPGQTREILYTKEGLETTLSVLRDPRTAVRELNINGQSTAFTTYMDLQVHRALGHLPVLCHPAPRSALVIGFGFGSTCYSILTHDLESLDCVELVRDEHETAHFFADVNHDVLQDPRLQFIVGDGRHHVLVTDRRYDILSFNAIHPKLSANLYTLDFYQLCRERLTEGGVIAAWLPINFLSGDEFRMLVRTFQRVFPHATLWYVGPGHAVLTGTLVPRDLDYARIAAALEEPAVKADLAASNLDDPCEIVAMYALDERGVARLAGEGPLNTDDRPRVEFGISFSSHEWYENLQAIYRETLVRPPPMRNLDAPAGGGEEARARLERFFEARRFSLYGSILQTVGLSMRDPEMIRAGIENYRRALEIVPDSRNTRKLLSDKEADFQALVSGTAAR